MNEYKKILLGDCCNISTGKLNANAQDKNGIYPFFTCNEFPFKINEYAFDTDAIIISGNGSKVGHINLYNGKFNAYQRTYVLDGFNGIIKKYLYYYLKVFLKSYINENSKKGSIPYITMPMLNNFEIRVPSLEIQNKIVNILDKYSEYLENIKNIISEKINIVNKLFENCINILVINPNTKLIPLLEVLESKITDGPHETPNLCEFGIPFISAEAITNNKINFDKRRGNISKEYNSICCKKYKPMINDIYIVKSGSTIGKAAIVETNIEFNIWSPLAALRVNKNNNPKFIFNIILSEFFQNQIRRGASKGSQPNIGMRVLEKLLVPHVDLETQNHYAELLEKLTENIQKEREILDKQLILVQKQYEYYRNKLLTFDNAD